MRILSIDGGGIRGLLAATMLDHIERTSGKPIADQFDMLAGTSTGGILACALACGVPAADLRALYRDKAVAIFSRSWSKRLSSGFGLFDEQYSAAGLEACLADVLGERMLSSAHPKLLVTAYDLSGRPHLFKSWEAITPEKNYPLRDVARATSAAPTFFEPVAVSDAMGFLRMALADGGLFANNPAVCALAEALKLGATLDEILMLSLGTGSYRVPHGLREARRWGVLRAAAPLLEALFEGQSAAADYQCRMLLGRRYTRLQAVLPRPLAMDTTDPEDLALMETLGAQLVENYG